MKSWARDFALGLLIATAIPPALAVAAPSAKQILLDKANYWRLKDRPDLAVQALQQLLSIDPNNQDAIYQYGILNVQQNKVEDAKSNLAKLRQLNPSSPHIPELENAIRAGQVSPNELNEARKLAQAGQFSQAAQKYEQTFKGPPPPTFGVEYYLTLAGTPQGWPEARKGLEQLTQSAPNDAGAKLALAEVLTYHVDTRPQGIRMLSQLAGDSVVGSQAKEAWAKSLMWLGNGPADRALYSQYIARYGEDELLRQHIAEAGRQGAATGGPGVPGPGSATAAGYSDLNRGNLGAAERAFEATLRGRPGDANALAGLGLIRLREQRFGEARDLLGRAMRADPARRGQWAAAYDSATFWSSVNAAKAADAAGDPQRAQQILTSLVQEPRRDNWNADLVLGSVDAKLNDNPGAEAAYRRVLAVQPDNADANVGLYSALAAQGKTAEAAQLQARLATLDPGKMAGLNRARADLLRSDGKALQTRGDVGAAQARFQEAIAVDPTDAWARLDFARFLVARGDAPQAFAVIDPTASGGSSDSFQAAAIFYSEQNRYAEAAAALDRIPANARNPELMAFRDRMTVTAEVGRAKQLAHSGNYPAARSALLALNQRPPASADKTRQVVDALADIGDLPDALQIGRPSTATADKKAVIDYASLLQRAGRDSEAAAYLAQTEATGRVPQGARPELEHVKGDIAAKRADALRERGDIAGAYDQVSPLLNAYPNDPTLLMATGRIYAAAGQNTVAMRFFDAAYQQAPGDLGVLRGAIGGAIVAGDLDRARAYLAQGMQRFPNNPRLYYMQAEIARASGDNGAAIYDLNIARNLDTQQAGAGEPMAPRMVPMPSGPGIPGSLPPNPFRQSEAETPRAPIQMAAATPIVASDASPTPAPARAAAAAPAAAAPAPLEDTAVSADSDDLVVPPHLGDRPPRPPRPAAALASNTVAPGMVQLAAATGPMGPPQVSDAATQNWSPPIREQLAQLPPLPPPPVPGYQSPYGASQASGPAPIQPYGQPYATAPMAPGYSAPGYAAQGYAAPGMASSSIGQPAPVPQDSLELDIERSMNAITAESGPTIQGGLAIRYRDGEEGLSRLTEIRTPIEGIFSPFYTGTMRLQAIPTFLTAGTIGSGPLLRFGHEPLLALPGSGATSLIPASGQNASGVSLNAAYTYQMFSGEVGTTPLGFPVENLVGRLALTWPGPGANTTEFPPIGLAPTTVANPLTVRVEGTRQAVTDSLLTYAGTRDPITGQVWGGVVKTGGDVLVSYDDGDLGAYAGGGYYTLDGRNVANNNDFEGLVGAYVRPYRSGTHAFKIGVNLSYMDYDKNLRFFTFGQGGYFSPQNYINVSVPMEYSGRDGRLTYVVGGAIGIQNFSENRSPVFPTEAGNQAALQAFAGNAAFYPSRTVTGPAFSARGQVEYELANGFSVGALASVDNAQSYTEAIGKLYLRKSFATTPLPSAYLPNRLPGSL